METYRYHWDTLYGLLSLARRANSKGEALAINKYIKPVCGKPDGFGNYIKIVGDNPTILWSSHTDTVHSAKSKTSQIVYLDKNELFVTGADCLGADCGAGVALMLAMIAHGVKGVYVFHRQEECGGNGSDFIVKNKPDWLQGIKACVAFDRYGFDSVITHQFGRCCSDDFANSFATQLNIINGFNYRIDTGGVFTDSANYVDLIGECTNISVGYLGHHTANETQCVKHLDLLLDALIDLDQDALVYSRQAGDTDTDYNDYNSWYDKEYQYYDTFSSTIANNADVVAEILINLGIDQATLEEEILSLGGIVHKH